MQLTYNANMNPAIAGTLYDLTGRVIDSFAVETDNVYPGYGVVGGTSDSQVKLPAAAVTSFKGIALLQAKEQNASGVVVFGDKDTVPVLTKGRIWGPVTGAVAIDAQAYLVHTGATAGKWAASAGLSAAAAAKSGGNATNTGALTLDATTPILAGAKVGVYMVRCIAAASNSGTFRVSDPDGFVLGDVAVGATFANDIKFAIADGTQDFIVGEGFDITISSTATAIAGAKFKTSTTGAGIAVVELN